MIARSCLLLSLPLVLAAAAADAPAKPLTRTEADAAVKAALRSIADKSRAMRAKELKSGVLETDGARMPIWAASFGDAKGLSLIHI